MLQLRLRYDRGTILLNGDFQTPYSVFDPRINKYRALGIYYSEIIHYFRRNKIDYIDKVRDYIIPLNRNQFKITNELRDYQKEAWKRWITHNMKGCIILPTGSGQNNNCITCNIENKYLNARNSSYNKFNGTMV